MPDYLGNALRISWGQKPKHKKSNARYFGLFSNKKLPGVGWRGWKPNINMKHVKMKTIQNEGMLLSDFGYYNSERAKAAYVAAPGIHNYSGATNLISNVGGVMNIMKLTAVLDGFGIKRSTINVEETSTPGLGIIGNIREDFSDARQVAGYKFKETFKILPGI